MFNPHVVVSGEKMNGHESFVARDVGDGWLAAIVAAFARAGVGDTITVPTGHAQLAKRIRVAKGFLAEIIADDEPYRRAGIGDDIRDRPPNAKTIGEANKHSFVADLPILGRKIVTPVTNEPGHYAWLGLMGWHDCTAAEDEAAHAQRPGDAQ